MQVPVYNKQVNMNAPRVASTQVSTPRIEDYPSNASEIANFTEGLNKAITNVNSALDTYNKRMDLAQKRELDRQSAERTTDAISGFNKEMGELLNGKVDDKGTLVSEGLLAREGTRAKGVSGAYNKESEAIKQKYLASAQTPEELDTLTRAFNQQQQNHYNQLVRFEVTEQKKVGNAKVKAYLDNAAAQAADITDAENMKTHLATQYTTNALNARGNGQTAEEIKQQKYKITSNNVTNSVNAQVGRLDFDPALKLIEAMKDDLSADDYNKLKNATEAKKKVWEEANAKKEEREQKAKEATYDSQKQVLYIKMYDKLASDPEGLQKEINEARRDPYAAIATYQKEYGINIKPTDINTYLNNTQKLLDDPYTKSGQIKQDNFYNLEQDTEAFKFEVDKKDKNKVTVKNKELRDPISVLSYIVQLDANIKNHSFTEGDTKEAEKKLLTARKAFAQLTPKIDDESALGAAVREIHTLINGGKTQVGYKIETTYGSGLVGSTHAGETMVPVYENYGGILTEEETSKALEKATKILHNGNINLSSTDPKAIKSAREAVQFVLHDTINQKFSINTEDVTDVQYGNNTFKSYGLKANPNTGASLSSNLAGYRYEDRNNVSTLVLRDKDGNIVHEVLAQWKPQTTKTK